LPPSNAAHVCALHHLLGLLIRQDIIVNILEISERMFDKFPCLGSISIDKFDIASVIVLNGCCEETVSLIMHA